MSTQPKKPSQPEKRQNHAMTMIFFPGVQPVAGITGDQHLYDVDCPYCQSQGDCAHLVACIDALNESMSGRADGLDGEFAGRIDAAFVPLLARGKPSPKWKSEGVNELWQWAESNWTANSEEAEIDGIVLFRLLTDILQEHAAHADYGSILEGLGIETEYVCIYDDDPVRVVDEAVLHLDRILKPIG